MCLNLYGTPTKKTPKTHVTHYSVNVASPSFLLSQASGARPSRCLGPSLPTHSSPKRILPLRPPLPPQTLAQVSKEISKWHVSAFLLDFSATPHTTGHLSIPSFSLSFSLLFAVSEYFLSCLSRLLSACLLAHCFPTIASYPQQSRGPYCFNPACIVPPANLLVSPWPLPQVADLNT